MTLTPSSPPKSAVSHLHSHDAHEHRHDHHQAHDHSHHHHDNHHAAPASVAIPFSFFRASALHLAGLAALISATLWLILIWAMR